MADHNPGNRHRLTTLSVPGFGSDMLSVLKDMRMEGVLLDVTLVAGEEEFMAHSTVLAYGSDYFRGLFTSGMKESYEKRVALKDPSIRPAAFSALLDFMYSGQLVVSPENVYDILAVASHLQAADLYSLQTLQKSLDTVIAESFLEMTSSGDFLESASRDELIKLLQKDNLAVPSEQQVYEAASRWLMHNASRMQHAASVLSHVRLALLDMGFLYEILQTDFGSIHDCRHLILEAMAYHGFSLETRQSLDWPRSKSRTQTDKNVLLSLSSQAQTFTTEGWRNMSDLSFGRIPVIAAAVVGNVLYMMCRSSFEYSFNVSNQATSSFKSYDPATGSLNTLSLPADYNVHSSYSQMVALGTKLFLVNGTGTNFQRKAWCFDVSAGRWTKSLPLPLCVGGVALTSCQGAVFAIGGNVSTTVDGKQTERPTSTVQAFFPTKNSWETVSPTTQPRAFASAMVQGDIIYTAGGKTALNGVESDNTIVEMCRVSVKDDVTVSSWSVILQPLSVHKFSSQVAIIDRKAYFVLGGQMHFTGKFVDHDHTSPTDVEDMCQSFRKDLQSGTVVCAFLAFKSENNG